MSEETQQQRLNRELIELLNELRVVLPGVQVLFAFILTVPFSRGYATVTHFEKIVFFVSLLATAISSALLIATPSYHRLRFRADQKEHIIVYGSRLLVAGFSALAVAMASALLMVATYLFGKTVGIATAAGFVAVVIVFWYGIAAATKVADVSRARRAR